jgi:hypothetical protein
VIHQQLAAPREIRPKVGIDGVDGVDVGRSCDGVERAGERERSPVPVRIAEDDVLEQVERIGTSYAASPTTMPS